MAYSLKRKESMERAVRRLGRERVKHALECLQDDNRADAIHCARKDIKKTRAVLRLVRTGIAKSDFKRLKTMLREAAAHLAAPRDAFIKLQTQQHLKEHLKGQLAPKALLAVQNRLRKNLNREMKRFGKEETASVVEKTLHRFAKTLERLKVKGSGWKAVSPGIRTAYRRGRRACHLASKDPSSENFHAWLKRVKDLGYHMRLLRPIWPE